MNIFVSYVLPNLFTLIKSCSFFILTIPITYSSHNSSHNSLFTFTHSFLGNVGIGIIPYELHSFLHNIFSQYIIFIPHNYYYTTYHTYYTHLHFHLQHSFNIIQYNHFFHNMICFVENLNVL